ncbi:MAG TPA: hypothetical protein ACHBY1_11400, partial [Arsenophonus nasoniae]
DHYWIQANVFKEGKMGLRDAQLFLSQGDQGAALGAAIGDGAVAHNALVVCMAVGGFDSSLMFRSCSTLF